MWLKIENFGGLLTGLPVKGVIAKCSQPVKCSLLVEAKVHFLNK